MMIFSELTSDLQAQLKRDLAQIRFLLKKNQGMAYTRIVEIGKEKQNLGFILKMIDLE